MKYKFNFRGENNRFIKTGNWDDMNKIDFVSSDVNPKLTSRINFWLNNKITNSIDIKKKVDWINKAISQMKNDDRSDFFIEKFLKSYIYSPASDKIHPINVYKAMLNNGIEQHWK